MANCMTYTEYLRRLHSLQVSNAPVSVKDAAIKALQQAYGDTDSVSVAKQQIIDGEADTSDIGND